MIIKETSGTPYVFLSTEDCKFEISGNSFSENINEVYQKILSWIDAELEKLNCELDCKFNFNVSNSVTYKNILIIMTKISELIRKGKKISVTWCYDEEDEDSLAVGEDIEELFDIPVKFLEKKELAKNNKQC
ncbi:MAG: DUF1987 domain-containing protein [Chlorobi bacterium]|nr:DUF1987 domain-containing protein [Chlorobiota bacterium]